MEESGRLMRREWKMWKYSSLGVWFDRGRRGNLHLKKMREIVEKWGARIGSMSRVMERWRWWPEVDLYGSY